MTEAIAPALLAWHDEAGRHDLPWQLDALAGAPLDEVHRAS